MTRKQVWMFAGAMLLLWFGSDWPVHDIGENYLYSVHMFQHMIFSYFMPPLALMATPTWMWRLLIGEGRLYRVGGVADEGGRRRRGLQRGDDGAAHPRRRERLDRERARCTTRCTSLVILSALLMWIPIVGPFPEWQIGAGAKCIYLFLMSVVPTVPAGWLTFAEGVVYKHYRQPVRVWGLAVTDDQQLAGAIMKIGGSFFIWAIVIYYFFTRFGVGFETENTYVRTRPHPHRGDHRTRRVDAHLRTGPGRVRPHRSPGDHRIRRARTADPLSPSRAPGRPPPRSGCDRSHDGAQSVSGTETDCAQRRTAPRSGARRRCA